MKAELFPTNVRALGVGLPYGLPSPYSAALRRRSRFFKNLGHEDWSYYYLSGTGKTSRSGEQRLPPGQHLTRDWPVLDLGLTRQISRERWRLDVYGAVEHPGGARLS